EAASAIGLEDSKYSTHSLRSTGATALFRGGASDLAIQLFGRWHSDAYKRYTRINGQEVAAEKFDTPTVAGAQPTKNSSETLYSASDLADAIQLVVAMTHTIASAAEAYSIPQRTLRYHIAKSKHPSNVVMTLGPNPSLAVQDENDLATWILAMDRDGNPVRRHQIRGKQLTCTVLSTATLRRGH
ncbi:hypothetical protein H257_18799, partial [Aphanomyces astaci]